MSLSLEQLAAFVATAKTGSFKQAAEHLKKHSTTVGEQVSNLEIDLGLNLFDRQVRKLTLTAEGNTLLAYADAVLNETKHFQTKAESLQAKEPDVFRLAVDTTISSVDLARCYKTVSDAFPALEFNVKNGDPFQVLEWVRNGDAEVGVLTSNFMFHKDITQTRLFNFEVVNILATDYPSSGVLLPDQEVRNITQIGFEFIRDGQVSKQHLISNHIFYANNVNEIIKMVINGLGWARVPRFIAEPFIEQGLLKTFKIESNQHSEWFVEAIRRTNYYANPVIKLFLEEAKKLPHR
ncbi:LysR family transcriptional regulator [Agarivorans aestuarii]|uniref:LysR family transcriptional regulator n=1 Tax=Agarivorans aestuarii TaxID=1563703 RepID=A0ABU7G895_9ALTE|nr:LysR family transcriptional regulator [Agarivorans aestuarii]MEE1675556.1 LysR family transcriptional regulator [Agarivorans aestuarii]